MQLIPDIQLLVVFYLDYMIDQYVLEALPDINLKKTRQKWLKNSNHTIEKTSSETRYKVNGVIHRENDKPAVIRTYKYTKIYYWFLYGQYHRDNNGTEIDESLKPAYISPDAKHWYQHGDLHREHGPAVTYSINGMFDVYYKRGNRVNK